MGDCRGLRGIKHVRMCSYRKINNLWVATVTPLHQTAALLLFFYWILTTYLRNLYAYLHKFWNCGILHQKQRLILIIWRTGVFPKTGQLCSFQILVVFKLGGSIFSCTSTVLPDIDQLVSHFKTIICVRARAQRDACC